MNSTTLLKAITLLGYESVLYDTINSEEDWNNKVQIISGADEFNTAIFYETKPITYQQVVTKYAEVEVEEKWEAIREKRNQLLAETDYLALSDNTMSAEMTAYRQALRDLPASTSNPDDVVFPTKP